MQALMCNLQDCFLCSFCVPGWKELIAVKKTTSSYKKGSLIFKEGEKVAGIYFIYSGAVKVHKQWQGQKEMVVRFAKAGDVLGHRGLGAEIYPVSATALEDVRICFITNDFLETTLQINQGLTYRLMQFYFAELQKTENRMRDLANMDVKGRIAGSLLELQDLYKTDTEGFIGVPINRLDIASYAGTTYETVFKFFTELKEANIISTQGKSIRVDDALGLRTFIDKQ